MLASLHFLVLDMDHLRAFIIPYGKEFSWGANFHYFRGSFGSHENFHPQKLMSVQ